MFEQLKHEAKKIGTFVSGRGAVSLGVGSAVAMEGISPLIGSFIALPLGTGVMAMLTQMDHDYNERSLLNFYREEVASKLHKSPKRVTTQDLRVLADGSEGGVESNPVIKEALQHNDRHRGMSLLIHGIAAVGTIAAVAAITAAGTALSPLVLGVGAMLCCTATDMVLQQVGLSVTGLDKPTQQQHIQSLQNDISAGRHISKQRVLGVMVACNAPLGKEIKDAIGADYASLSHETRKEVAELYAQKYPLAQLAHDLNTGQVKPQELAFITHGQASGVTRLESPVSGISERAREAAHAIWEGGKHKLHSMSERVKMAIHHPRTSVSEANMPHETIQALSGNAQEKPPANTLPASAFFEPRHPLGHVERLEQSRANSAAQSPAR